MQLVSTKFTCNLIRRPATVKIDFTPKLVVETPHQLFERRFDRDPGGNLPNYDVTADGQHFVMLRPTQTPHEIRLTLDWIPEP